MVAINRAALVTRRRARMVVNALAIRLEPSRHCKRYDALYCPCAVGEERTVKKAYGRGVSRFAPQ